MGCDSGITPISGASNKQPAYSSGILAMLMAMRFIAGQQLGGGSTTRLVLVIQICKRLPAVIADDEARAVVLNFPRCGGKRLSGIMIQAVDSSVFTAFRNGKRLRISMTYTEPARWNDKVNCIARQEYASLLITIGQ